MYVCVPVRRRRRRRSKEEEEVEQDKEEEETGEEGEDKEETGEEEEAEELEEGDDGHELLICVKHSNDLMDRPHQYTPQAGQCRVFHVSCESLSKLGQWSSGEMIDFLNWDEPTTATDRPQAHLFFK